MGENTAISWANHTFNPWIGCTRISPACDGCYAAHLMDTRLGRVEWGGPRERTSEANWRKPLQWQKQAEAVGNRPFVFCSSLADVFDNQVPSAWRADLFDLIRRTPRLVWLLLTKRPQNIASQSRNAGGLPPNAAIGTTVEDQKRANINVPALLQASEDLWRAETRPLFTFLSCEPLLEVVDLTSFKLNPHSSEDSYRMDALSGRWWLPLGTNKLTRGHIEGDREYVSLCHRIDWVISGGETDQGDHRARPTPPEAFRSLRDQCARAGIPFHHKQNGEWVSVHSPTVHGDYHTFPDGSMARRVGKHRSGREIDGVTHDAFPRVAA